MIKIYPFILLFFYFSAACAQTRTVGVVKYTADQQDGYCLFSPVGTKKTFLIDKCGRQIKEWTSYYPPGLSVSLTPSGELVRTGSITNGQFGAGVGGVIEKYSWDGDLLWQYMVSDSQLVFHHDIKVMPNGNILAILWEMHSIADAIAAGRDPDNTKYTVWSERIQELQPIGKDSAAVVWEWRAWDHLIQDFDSTKPNYGNVKLHRERFDINFTNNNIMNTGQDWFHFNSIDYHPGFDQIMMSSHSLDEIYIIDHSTSSYEAASTSGGRQSKGGDILYRWGNAPAYKTGDSTNWNIFHGHHANWIPDGMAHEGEIMFFNNGLNKTGSKYSTVDRILPPVNGFGEYNFVAGKPFLPSKATVVYRALNPTTFYTPIMGGAYPIGDNRILTTLSTSGIIYEMHGDSVVWQYVNPYTLSGTTKQGNAPGSNYVFRCEFYPTDYAAFDGRSMTPGVEIESQPYAKKLCDKPLPPLYAIAKINKQNSVTGIADSLGVKCRITGVIQSKNWGENGMQYILADRTGNTLLFDTSLQGLWNPGDSVMAYGMVGQRMGWHVFTTLDSVVFLGANKKIKGAVSEVRPDEIHESQFISMKRIQLVNPLAWPTTPLSAGQIARLAIKHTDGTLDSLYIYSATDIDGSSIPSEYFDISGFVGQFDPTKPFGSGYALLPTQLMDITRSALPEINFVQRSDTNIAGNGSYVLKVANTSQQEDFECRLVYLGGSAMKGTDFYFTDKTISISKNAAVISESISVNALPDFTGIRYANFALRSATGPGVIGKDSLFTLNLRGKTLNGISEKYTLVPTKIFPNPTTHVIHLFAATAIGDWCIQDACGRVMLSGTCHDRTLDIPLEMVAGCYWLKINHAQGRPETIPLVLQK